MTRRIQSKTELGARLGFRSGLEDALGAQLTARGIPFEYEGLTLPYEVKETRKYTPDFLLLRNGIVVESKGRWVTADRKKIRLIREQHPDVDLRLVFSNSRAKIGKKSKTTYGMYAANLGILYSDKIIDPGWFKEPPNERSLAAIARLQET